MKRSLVFLPLTTLLACAHPNAPVTATAPATAPAPPAKAAGPDPWQLPPRAAKTTLPAKVAGPVSLDAFKHAKSVAKPPAVCAAFATRVAATPAPASLDEALVETDAPKRDALLAALETTTPDARVVRADLAPVECADLIAEPLFAKKDHFEGAAEHALVGLALAAKLARTANGAPVMPAGADKSRVKAFVQGPLKKWLLEQASAIESLSVAGRELVGYGRGVAAIEAGTADLRLVDTIRSSPVPKEWDAELKQIYEASLDEALEPRKARGRDAALVGLGELASAGALNDVRVGRARVLLAKLYGGRRIDALDGLFVPPLGSGDAPELASSYWRHAKLVDGSLVASPRAHFEAGRLYWERAEFIEAAYGYKDAKTPDERLLLANALALATGPANAAEMMRRPIEITRTDALDALATGNTDSAGAAAYDAAHLRSLSTMGTAGATSLKDIATRFTQAASLLTDQAQKKKATDRATDATSSSSAK